MAEELKPIPWNIESLYSSKVVILLEEKPLSDKYNQIFLTKEQFKMFNSFIFNMFPKVSPESKLFNIQLCEREPISLPESLCSFYEQKK